MTRSGKGPFQFLREIKPISAGSLFYGIPDLSRPFGRLFIPAIPFFVVTRHP